MAVKINYGWPVTVLALIFAGAIIISLGIKGVVGALIAMLLFHISYRVKHGYWFDEESG
jgi:hypothetical protein